MEKIVIYISHFSNLQSKHWQIIRAGYTCFVVRDLVRTDITCLAMIIYRMTVGFAFIINPLVIRLFAKHRRLLMVLYCPARFLITFRWSCASLAEDRLIFQTTNVYPRNMQICSFRFLKQLATIVQIYIFMLFLSFR